MSHPVAAKQYPNSIFKQTTPDEEQALLDEPRFQTWYKGWLTRSEIYERKLPDGITSALRIDGPSDSALSLDGKGNIRILTGKKTEVAGSGVLGIKTWGQQQLHNERSNIQYCAGGTENEGQALNVLAYGDVVEECIGSTRYIKAAKIEITATEELVLNGQVIKLQAQGDIEMSGASINTAQVNKKDIVLGQKMSYGAGESTDLQFDPRATVNVVSPGHINHKVLGDYKMDVGGVSSVIVAGGTFAVPFLKDRSSSYTVKTVVGGQNYDAAGFINRTAGGAIADNAAGAFSATAGGDASMSAGGTASIDAGGEASINAGAAVNVTAVGNVSIQGALILLN